MKNLIKHITAPWRKPTIEEMAIKELESAKRALFTSETMMIYHQSQKAQALALIPVLERKIREVRQEHPDA